MSSPSVLSPCAQPLWLPLVPHRCQPPSAQIHCHSLSCHTLATQPLPDKVRCSGEGYTLSGKPLDPTSAAATAYGFKPHILMSECFSSYLKQAAEHSFVKPDQMRVEGAEGAGQARAAEQMYDVRMGAQINEAGNNRA